MFQWVTCAGIAQPGENMPWRGDGEEEQKAGGQAELTPAAPIAGEQQVRRGGQEEEDRSDEPFGQHGERQRSPSQVKTVRFLIFQSDEKIVEGKGEQEVSRTSGMKTRVNRKTPTLVRTLRAA